MKLRGRVERARDIDITGIGRVEREYIPGGWFYEVIDLDRPLGWQIIEAGARGSQPAALAAACAVIKLRSGGAR